MGMVVSGRASSVKFCQIKYWLTMVKTSEHYIIPLTLLFINVIICSHLVFYLTHTLNVLASTAALEY